MSRQTLEEKFAEIKDLYNSVTIEVVETLMNTNFPSEKCIELAEAISTVLLNKYDFLKTVLIYIRCKKN